MLSVGTWSDCDGGRCGECAGRVSERLRTAIGGDWCASDTLVVVLFGWRGWSENLPTGKNCTSERSRLGIVAGFNPPECKGEPPPGARAFVITLVPAPSKFDHATSPAPHPPSGPARHEHAHLHPTPTHTHAPTLTPNTRAQSCPHTPYYATHIHTTTLTHSHIRQTAETASHNTHRHILLEHISQ